MASQAGDVAVFFTLLEEVFHYLWIEQVAEHVTVGGLLLELLQVIAGCLKVSRRQELSRAAGNGLLSLEYHFLQASRLESPSGLSHHSLEIAYH